MTNQGDGDQVDLSGQVALVTGGGRGLGQAYVQGLAAAGAALATAGAAVAVTARSTEQLDETVRLIEAAGGRALAIPADVTDRAAVEAAVATTERELGSIDLLVNNAGIAGPWKVTWETDPTSGGAPWRSTCAARTSAPARPCRA